MNLRIARHTDSLKEVISFYTNIIGMQILGKFEDHNGYDGVFLGYPNADWHLEFTSNNKAPQHSTDDDDLLVIYPDTLDEYMEILERFEKAGIPRKKATNPYWNDNGALFLDPDGFGVIISPQKCH